MKKLILLSGLVWLSVLAMAQQALPPRLIVRADDMGSFQAANGASLRSYTNGIVTSIEVMAVTPWFPEAARMLRENPGVDVGLHLVITSEWDNVKWRPLTHCPGLTDDNGYFQPRLFPDKNYPGGAIMEQKWTPEEIEREFRAQIELALKNIPHISHLSGHMGSTAFDPRVAEITARLAEEFHLPCVDRNLMTYVNQGAGTRRVPERRKVPGLLPLRGLISILPGLPGPMPLSGRKPKVSSPCSTPWKREKHMCLWSIRLTILPRCRRFTTSGTRMWPSTGRGLRTFLPVTGLNRS